MCVNVVIMCFLGKAWQEAGDSKSQAYENDPIIPLATMYLLSSPFLTAKRIPAQINSREKDTG